MSFVSEFDSLDFQKREEILNDLTIRIDPGKYGQYVRALNSFVLIGDRPSRNIVTPFSYSTNKLKLPRRVRSDLANSYAEFLITLRDKQLEVRKEALTILNRTGSCVLSLHCGFGKTVLATNISCRIKLRTLVIVNKVVLLKQWEESIRKSCPGCKVCCMLPSKKSISQDADFYIANAVNIPKFYDTETGKTVLDSIGTVVVDECHLIMAETLVQSLLHVTPRYLIGLSATPYRSDSFDQLIDLYFGAERIVRKLYREHIIYKVNSGFKPDVQQTGSGTLNWGAILDSQARDESRNNLIVDIIDRDSSRTFLVLVKRVVQGESLLQMLNDRNISCTSLLGGQQTFDRAARVLIGTIAKVGTGFDHDKLNGLILAADVAEYFIQYLGRIFRTKDGVPVVYDIVDSNPVLQKHFNTRKEVYIEHGGKVRTYSPQTRIQESSPPAHRLLSKAK